MATLFRGRVSGEYVYWRLGETPPMGVEDVTLVSRDEDLTDAVLLKGEVTGTTPEVLGSRYVEEGWTLSATSEALVGVLASGTATLRMVRESDSTLVATWVSSSALGVVTPTVLVSPLTPGWYVFDLAGSAGDTVSRAYGVWLSLI